MKSPNQFNLRFKHFEGPSNNAQKGLFLHGKGLFLHEKGLFLHGKGEFLHDKGLFLNDSFFTHPMSLYLKKCMKMPSLCQVLSWNF